MTTASVEMWGRRIGAVTWDPRRQLGLFEYDKRFARSGIQVAPLTMPLSAGVFLFPELARGSFHGLPGMLADTLPDRFGNALIDAWLASRGRTPEDFDPVERLCYQGTRGMGALEFQPALAIGTAESRRVEVDRLVELANAVLAERGAFAARIVEEGDTAAMQAMLRLGTSAGGARAKAVVAWNPATGEFRSGQVPHDAGFSDWILKFDGVYGNRDKEQLEDPQGYGRIELAYHHMAVAAGITMSECRLFEEGGRAHFMTRRFDRTAGGAKLHMQSLCALQHLDFNLAGAHGYEQAVLAIRRLGLPMRAVEEQYRRMAFHVLARNQDDHTKNIAFLMDPTGAWSLAPAFDEIFAFNPGGAWTSRHQMTIGGKRDGFSRADFDGFGRTVSMKRGRAAALFDEVRAAVLRWPEFAAAAGVPEATAARIGGLHRVRELAP